MESTNEQLLERIDSYIETLFVPRDDLADVLAQCLSDAQSAGLPNIQVSPNQGKLLYILARLTRASRILEIGTLGGYSTIWLASALPADGSLITLEISSMHAEVARASLGRAGFGDRVEVVVGAASDSLHGLIHSGVQPFDLIFIDADKTPTSNI